MAHLYKSCVIKKINGFPLSSTFGGVPLLWRNGIRQGILFLKNIIKNKGIKKTLEQRICFLISTNLILWVGLTGWISNLYVIECIFNRRVRTQKNLAPGIRQRGQGSFEFLLFHVYSPALFITIHYYRDDPNPEYEP